MPKRLVCRQTEVARDRCEESAANRLNSCGGTRWLGQGKGLLPAGRRGMVMTGGY